MLKYLKIPGLLILLVILGFGSKYYRGPAFFWVNNSLGGVFYVAFWCVFFSGLFGLFRLGPGPIKLCLWVTAVTCVLEILQLVDNPLLVSARITYLGSILLGTTFIPSDFIYYFIGGLLGWLLLRRVNSG